MLLLRRRRKKIFLLRKMRRKTLLKRKMRRKTVTRKRAKLYQSKKMLPKCKSKLTTSIKKIVRKKKQRKMLGMRLARIS